MEFWKIILTYLIQPLVWVGIIMAVIVYRQRLAKERRFFRIAIDRDFYEGRHFLKTAIFGLVVGSIISLLAGLMLTFGTIVFIEAVAILAVLLLPLGDLSLAALWLAVLLTNLLNLTNLTSFSLGTFALSFSGSMLPASGLLLLGIYFIIRAFLLHYNKSTWFTPKVKSGKRGRRVAFYNWKEFSVIPLILLVPTNVFESQWSFWPVLSFNGHSFGLFILPLLVAASLKVFKEEPQVILDNFYKQSITLGICSIIAAGISVFYPIASLLGLLFIGGLALYYYFQRQRLDAKGKRWYVETNDGVRVIAVIPDTPAAKMGVQKGDIILDCNDEEVKNESELYAALQKNSAYCHLRIRTFEGDLKITESAIYADGPHEIGLILFQ